MRSRFGTIQSLPNGRYRVHWQEGGKKRSKRIEKYNDACLFLASKQVELMGSNCSLDLSTTWGQFYNLTMPQEYKGLAVRTVADYKYMWSVIAPYIENKQVRTTTWRDIQWLLDKLPSNSAQEKALKILKKMSNIALRDELIKKNPCVGKFRMKKPKKKKKELYTREELIEILNRVEGTQFALPVLLECCCGLRHEEYCALNNRDFEFSDKYGDSESGWVFISVSKALTNNNGRNVLKNTKTAESERIVCLDERFRKYLLKHSKFMKNKRTLKEYVNPAVLTRRWHKYCDKNNIRYVPFGHMRSVYATLAVEAGCLDSLVQKALGHSGKSILEKNYQSVTVRALKMNARAFSDYLGFEDKLPSLERRE